MVASRKRAQGRTRVVEPSAKQKKFNATVQDIRDRFEARADPSCKLSPKEKFDAAQRDLEKLVDAIGEFLGRKLHFRRILLPEDAEWNESGLKEEFNVIIGHFETDGIGLRGNLRKLRATGSGSFPTSGTGFLFTSVTRPRPVALARLRLSWAT